MPTAALNTDSSHAKRAYILALLFLVAALCVLQLDIPVARICLKPKTEGSGFRIGGDIRRALNLTEVFAHGFGVAMIGATLLVLLPDGRRRVVRVLVCAYGSGLAAHGVKLLVTRVRPNGFPVNPKDGLYELPVNVGDTFLGWISSDPFNRAIHSFPSGHTATAVGLALALAWLLPRGRWLFALFALLASLQRVVAGAHYLSDVCAAGVVSSLFTGLCLDRRLLGRWFDRIEQTAAPKG